MFPFYHVSHSFHIFLVSYCCAAALRLHCPCPCYASDTWGVLSTGRPVGGGWNGRAARAFLLVWCVVGVRHGEETPVVVGVVAAHGVFNDACSPRWSTSRCSSGCRHTVDSPPLQHSVSRPCVLSCVPAPCHHHACNNCPALRHVVPRFPHNPGTPACRRCTERVGVSAVRLQQHRFIRCARSHPHKHHTQLSSQIVLFLMAFVVLYKIRHAVTVPTVTASNCRRPTACTPRGRGTSTARRFPKTPRWWGGLCSHPNAGGAGRAPGPS